MSRPPTYARKRDRSHQGIVDALRVAGCSVREIQSPTKGLPDLICGFQGRDHMVEAKNPSKSGRQTVKAGFSEAQEEFAAGWRGARVNVVRTPQEAFELVATWRREAEVSKLAANAMAFANARNPGQFSLAVGGTGGVNFETWTPEQKNGKFIGIPKEREAEYASRTPAEVEPRHYYAQQNQNTPSNKP